MFHLELVGGPPWGFRYHNDQELRPVVSTVLSGGRANMAGIREGDILVQVDSIPVTSSQAAFNEIQKAHGRLLLRVNRPYPTVSIKSEQSSPAQKKKSLQFSSVPTSPTQPRTNPFITSSSPRQVRMDVVRGSKDNTENRRRFFENLNQNPEPSANQNKEGVADSWSSIGYDSASGDYAGRSNSSSFRSSPLIDVMEDVDERTIIENMQTAKNGNLQAASQLIQNNTYKSNNNNNNNIDADNTITAHKMHENTENPTRMRVSDLRQVLNDRLEMKTPVGGVSSSRPKTPNEGAPSWSNSVRVHEPTGYQDPHANKHFLGRVLDGPADPHKFFQGVPPPSYHVVHHPTESKPPAPPPKPAAKSTKAPNVDHNFNQQTYIQKPPAILSSTQAKQPRNFTQLDNYNSSEFRGYPDDDSMSMISSCLSTVGDSSEVAAYSAIGAARTAWDVYRQNQLKEALMNPPRADDMTDSPMVFGNRNRQEADATPTTETNVEEPKVTLPPASIFNTDIQLTPFGQANVVKETREPSLTRSGSRQSMDLESSELLLKSKSPQPYSSFSTDHYGTIRKRHTPVRMESSDQKEISNSSTTLEPRSNDSGYEGSTARSPDENNDAGSSSLTSSVIYTPEGGSSEGFHPNQLSPTSTLDDVDDMARKNRGGGGGDDGSDLLQHQDMSSWYKNMFKKMHIPSVDRIPNGPLHHQNSREQSATPTIQPLEPSSHQAQKHQVDITPRRERSVGLVIDPAEEQSKNRNANSSKNLFAFERSRTSHFHLPPFQLEDELRSSRCSLTSCVGGGPSGPRCRKCGRTRRDPSFEETEVVYKQMSRNIEREEHERRMQKRIALKCITDRLDATTSELQEFIDHLDKTWQRSKSQPIIRHNARDSTPQGLASEIADLKRISREEVLLKQKADRLSEELQREKERKHNFIPSSTPSLQHNMQRFDHLMRDFQRSSPIRDDVSTTSQKNGIVTATVIYPFDAKSSRELPLNKGDIVRIISEVDSHWLRGERNGRSGIFPASYVQVEAEYERSRQKMRSIYPFTARNPNELSLKKGEIVTFRREVDANWSEGSNQIGQIGIFPSSYVRMVSDSPQEHQQAKIPDRPKTPKLPGTDDNRSEHRPTVRFDDSIIKPQPSVSNGYAEPVNYGYIERTPTDRLATWESRRSQERTPERYSREGSRGVSQEPVANKFTTFESAPSVRSNAGSVIPKGSEMYRAMFAYAPEKSDEIELRVNDIIFVVEKCDDGWFIGTSLRSGEFGTFPGNYVQRH